MVPETGKPTTGEFVAAEKASSSMDAVTKGTIQGVELVINIVAMLVVLVALVHLVNLLLGLFPDFGNEPDISSEDIGIYNVSCGLAHGNSVERGSFCRYTDGNKNHFKRTDCLC